MKNKMNILKEFQNHLSANQKWYELSWKFKKEISEDLSEGMEAAKIAASRVPEIFQAGHNFGGYPIYIEPEFMYKVANLYRKYFPDTIVCERPDDKVLMVWVRWDLNVDMIKMSK